MSKIAPVEFVKYIKRLRDYDLNYKIYCFGSEVKRIKVFKYSVSIEVEGGRVYNMKDLAPAMESQKHFQNTFQVFRQIEWE